MIAARVCRPSRRRLVEADGVGDTVDAVADVTRDVGRGAAGGDGVQDLVVDESAHLLPAALLGQCVEFGLQVLPAVCGQHRPVRGRRPVERQQRACPRVGLLALGVGFACGHDDLGQHGEVGGVAACGSETLAHHGHGVVVQEPLRAERHHQQTVGVLSDGTGQPRPECADVDRWRAVRIRAWVERRRHQGVPVVVAAKIQPLAGVPGREDRPQRRDQFGHPGHRFVELGAETLFDLGADLGSQAQSEPARAQQLMIIGLVCQVNRVARECDSHIGHQVQAGHGRRQRQRGEHIVRPLEGGDSAGARVAKLPRAVGRVGQCIESGEDFQRGIHNT